MNFAFFYPLAWLGAVAIAVPIWLHLHRRRETNLVMFSALRFLDDQPIARQQPLWPRDLPLLLLRLLGLLLIIAAFAWPYLVDEQPRQVVTESVVYILDNTLSHQAGGKFEAAREQLADQLESTPPARQTAVIELTSAPRVLGNFSDDARATAKIVRQREASSGRGSYLAAFRQADELLRQSLGQKQRIVVLADHQRNQWNEGRQSPPFLRNIEVEPKAPEDESLPNLAIWQPRARRTRAGDEHRIECSMRLFHQGPAESVNVEIRANGETIGTREIDLKGEPQIMNLAFEWPADDLDWVQGELLISGAPNELSGDDRGVFSVPPQRPGVVGAIASSPFLKTALAPDIMQDRWITRWLTAEQLDDQESSPDLLCIELGQLDRKPIRDFALQHLDQGRGMLLMVDDLSASGKAFLKQFGVEALPRVQMPPTEARIRYFYSEHPLLAPFQSGELGNLLDVAVERFYPLQCDEGVPLVFANTGDAIVMQVPAKGPIVLLGFALERRDTSWPIHTSFIPFLDLCFHHVRPMPPALESMAPGEACTWQIPATQHVREVIVRRGDEVVVRAKGDGGQAKFVLPSKTGLYALYYDASAEPAAMLEVNPAPAESELAYTDPKATIAGWKLPEDRQATTNNKKSAAGPLSEAAILRQQIWWWLLLSGAAALILETSWLALRKGQR